MPAPRHHIRAWRKHRGLTQVELAAAIGMDRSYLTKIERGDRRYDQPFLEAAARALDCTPGDMIGRDPTDSAELEAVWATLTPEERTRAIAVIRAMFSPA